MRVGAHNFLDPLDERAATAEGGFGIVVVRAGVPLQSYQVFATSPRGGAS